MENDSFLARTEEQGKFKQVLDSLMSPGPTLADKPFVYLLYGEGGMGKTRLMQRLREIAQESQPYEGEFNTLFMDWEVERNNRSSLNVGHDSIRPETVLRVIHDAFSQRGWGRSFDKYREVAGTLEKAESKIDKKLRSKPENEQYSQLLKNGPEWLAALIRDNIPVIGKLIPQQLLETGISATAQWSAEIVTQARTLVQETLTSHEYQVYREPHTQLALALGQAIAALAKNKPLIIFLDTYEVVDTMECDYVLRQAMLKSSARVVWAIAGRANLADSAGRGDRYFRGYRHDFPDDRIYAKALTQFGWEDIRRFFAHDTPERPLSEEQTLSVAEFTLGIPFAVSEAAAMWRAGATLEEMVAPGPLPQDKLHSHQHVVNAMSERFLKHCINSDKGDRRAVYALALVRRPDADLLRAMLGANSLTQELQSLKDRYSFIMVDEMRLEEKLNTFLQEYLLVPIRRTDPPVSELAAAAVAFLQRRLAKWTSDLVSAEERLGDDRTREAMADLVHQLFWQDEDAGWRYLIPRFVEGLQYDPEWARSLLEIAGTFSPTFSEEGKRRLRTLRSGLGVGMFVGFAGTDSRKLMLAEIEKLVRHGWLNGEGKEERTAILLLERGKLLYREEKYKDALRLYLEAEKHTAENMQALRTDLGNEFSNVGFSLGWRRSKPVRSVEGRTAFERAVELNPEDNFSHFGLGVTCFELKDNAAAFAHFRRSLELDPKHVSSHDGLGTVYSNQGKYDEAIAEYKRAIELDPSAAIAHNNLGRVYNDQGKYDEAIAEYKRAIEVDPTYSFAHNNLGITYSDQGKYDEAIAEYKRAIEVDRSESRLYEGLGTVYYYQGKYDEAIAEYKRAIELDPSAAVAHNNLGITYYNQGKYNEAIAEYKRAIEVDPTYNLPYNNLAGVYLDQGRLEDASAELAKAVQARGQTYIDIFYTGIILMMRGQANEARRTWQKALALYQNHAPNEQATYGLLTLLVGETERGLAYLREIIRNKRPGVGLITLVLRKTELAAKCPNPPSGIEEMKALLQAAVAEQAR